MPGGITENSIGNSSQFMEFTSCLWSRTEQKRALPVPLSPQAGGGHTQSCAILRSNMRGLTPCREMDFTQMIQAIPQQINKQITITSPKVGGSDQNLELHSELSKIPSF